jgi:uncharacterized SAM-binding protein YcdF (DUF218 family)
MRWTRALLWTIFLILMVGGVAGALVYTTIPLENTQQAHFDAIIVLGYPANADGTPSPVERVRVIEGVREYRRGIAPALIMTGGAAHNQHIEADVMADFAVAQGVPAMAILREKQAHDTIQNAHYSMQLMRAHGWQSAEVVSSRSHLPRASLIFARFPLQYQMHGAPNPAEMGWLYDCAAYLYEVQSTDRIRLFGFKSNRYLPR